MHRLAKTYFFVRFNRVQGTRFGLYDFNESLEVNYEIYILNTHIKFI